MHEQKQIYSLRKLSVGLASVIVGTCFFISTNRQQVKADTVNAGEQPTSTVIQQDNSKKQEQNSNEQNDQTNVSNSKTEQQQSTPSAKDVENVDSNLNDTNKLDNATKPVESEANQKFDQAKNKFKQDTSIDADVPSSVTKDVKKIRTNTLKVVKKSTVNPDSLSLKESKAVNLNNNGGFDEATWGKLDVNAWQGSVVGDYYQLSDYTGDANHVIVPNEADFAKAGISTSGKQVGVTRDLMHTIFADKATATDATVAFSKTNNKMVKAIGSNWSHTWDSQDGNGAMLSNVDGTNLDVSNVTDMSYMFTGDNTDGLSSLANWNVNNVTNMSYMFNGDSIDNLSPLAKWNVNNVTNMSHMFDGNRIRNLSPLAKWNVNNVTNMSYMFYGNRINDVIPLADWKVDNVTNMVGTFYNNQISDLSPLAKWNVNSVTNMSHMFSGNRISNLSSLAKWNVNNVTDMSIMFLSNQISDLSPLANWKVDNVTNMSAMFEQNQISDLSSLVNWKVDNVTDMARMFENNQISDISPLANWDTSKVTNMNGMFENTPLKKVKLTNWDFSNINPSNEDPSIFPDTDFEATLSDKTSKSLLDISSKLSDSVKEAIKDKQDELKQAEQEYQYYLTGDGKKEYDGQIQDLQEQFNQYKQEIQQEINQYKLQAEYPLNAVFGNHSKITTPNRNLLIYLVGKLPVKSDTATRTIEITFPDGTKKTINQSVGYGKYAISGTADMATHKLDMAMPYELSKWELIKKEDGSYDLVKAHVDKNGVASFDNVALPKVAGYKAVVTLAKQNAINPMAQMFMVSFVALPKQPNTEQLSPSSSSVTDKANNSHDLHDDSKKQNDQPITSNKENDHTINVSAQVVDPTVEPEKNDVASQNNSTTSAQTQQSSTNDAEQPTTIPADRVVNDQTDDNFSDPSREENNANRGSNSLSNRSKPDSGKIIHVDVKSAQNGLNEPSKARSVATHPATSVINNSKSDSQKLPQTGENNGYQYSVLGLLLGLNAAMTAVYAEKKHKKY